MAITNSISSGFPARGIPFYAGKTAAAWQSVGNALTTVASPQTTTLALPAPLTRGRWRIKLYNTTNTPTFIVKANFGDGTNTSDVLLPLAAFTPTDEAHVPSGIELSGEFILDINATTFNVVTTLAGAGGTASMDIEVFGAA